MTTRGSSRAAATGGLIIVLLAASAGVNSVVGGGFGLLLSFAGVLAGASVIAVGVRLADGPAAPVGPAAFAGARALAAPFMRRGLAFAGLAVASSASTAVQAGDTGPAFCFGAFVLLLLGLALINIGVFGALV